MMWQLTTGHGQDCLIQSSQEVKAEVSALNSKAAIVLYISELTSM